MIEEVAGGVFKVVVRILGHILLEVIFELIVKGPGYLICKLFTKRDLDPDGFVVVLTGFLFWLVIGVGAYSLYATVGGNGDE